MHISLDNSLAEYFVYFFKESLQFWTLILCDTGLMKLWKCVIANIHLQKNVFFH